jgi:hypothetical protein
MLLIDDRPPPPAPEERPAWEPNWHVVAWIAVAAVVGFASFSAHGVVGAALMTAAFGALCRAFSVALPYGGGLTEWRQ